MKIRIRTEVKGAPDAILAQFGRPLFEALTPRGVEVLRFDGSYPGCRVHIRMRLPLLPLQHWESEITEREASKDAVWFTDEGRRLPFFLSAWRHVHRVERAGAGSCIVDDISFRTPWWIPALLMAPVLYLQFAARRPVYRKWFGAA